VSIVVAHNVRMKRVYDPPSPEDGYRVLATRYWPRGVPKSAKDEYVVKLAPSKELLREFKHESLSWGEYVPRYIAEMRNEAAQSEIRRLANLAESRTITLMCVCEDELHCHRSLLRQLIVESGEPA
jgi:uncharacterized protein YeaO (DUF488 family)